VPALEAVVDAVEEKLCLAHRHNHWIVTRYMEGRDNIGLHSDKTKDVRTCSTARKLNSATPPLPSHLHATYLIKFLSCYPVDNPEQWKVGSTFAVIKLGAPRPFVFTERCAEARKVTWRYLTRCCSGDSRRGGIPRKYTGEAWRAARR
jgi:hypothetical protein